MSVFSLVAATSDLLPLTLASSLLWQQPLAARADEAAPAAAVEAVTEGAQQAVTAAAGAATDAAAGPSWLSYAGEPAALPRRMTFGVGQPALNCISGRPRSAFGSKCWFTLQNARQQPAIRTG